MKLFKFGGKRVAGLAAAAVCFSVLMPTSANGAALTGNTLTPTNPTADAASTTYTLAMGSAAATARCVRIHFGTSAAFAGLPSGMAFATPVMTVNATGFTTTNTGDYVQGTNAGGVIPTSITVTNVHNPTARASYYYKVETFTDQACTTPGDEGIGGFATTDNTVVSVTVDPSFTFTVANQATACNGESDFQAGAGTATAVALGRLAVSSNKSGGQLLSVSGNAGGGYAVYARSTNATTNLRSTGLGAHNWADVAGSYASPAALGSGERFGFTWKDNEASGSVVNPASATFAALDNTNRAVLDAGSAVSSGNGCISFDAQTGSATPAGVYTATVIYTAVPVF